MRSLQQRWMGSRTLRTVVAGVAILGIAHTALARDDSGVHEFFNSMFGGGAGNSAPEGAAEQAQPAPQPRSEATPYARSTPYARPTERAVHRAVASRGDRPLTVKLNRPKIVRPAQIAQGRTAPVKVSIFEDKTLQRGDAVMTAKGIRIFAGSNSWPYQPSDFVALSSARQMDQGMRKVLLDLDRMPHS